jgi:hypothetical protein
LYFTQDVDLRREHLQSRKNLTCVTEKQVAQLGGENEFKAGEPRIYESQGKVVPLLN